jgi:hypothetical protein
MVRAPITGGGAARIFARGGEVSPTDVIAWNVVFAPGEVEYLQTRARKGGGRSGKLTLILIIDENGLAEDGDRFGAGNPIEVSVHQE